MKTIEDLKKVQEKSQELINLRKLTDVKITVSMDGDIEKARQIMFAFLTEIDKRNLENIAVFPAGENSGAGVLVNVLQEGKADVSYPDVNLGDIEKIIEKHAVKSA